MNNRSDRNTYVPRQRRRALRRRKRRRRFARAAMFFVCAASLLVLGYVLFWGGHMMTEYVNQRARILPEEETARRPEPAWNSDGTEAAWAPGSARSSDGTEAAWTPESAWSSDDAETARNPGIDLTRLYSRYALLMDAATGEVLAEHAGGERMYPASLTKMMTAVLLIEDAGSLDDPVTVPEEIFPRLYAEEASMAGFQPGEEASARDLLYGILLPSGAECCLAAAVKYAGSEDAFVEQMNEKAAELGMEDTHFCNCTGLHDSGHYTTAEDLARLLLYALQYEEFREAFTAGYYVVRPDDWYPEGFTMHSTMFESMDGEALACGILGGKTGYTEEAGLCLASLAQVGGREYILVTAGAEGSHETKPFHIMDAVSVYQQLAQRDSLSRSAG